MKLIYSLSILFFIFSLLYGENYGSVSGQVTDQESDIGLRAKKYASILGQVTDEKTGAGIPGVKVIFSLSPDCHTDVNGIYTIKNIRPDTFYTISFHPPHPYCYASSFRVFIEGGENIVNHTLGNGGSLMGRVYKSRGIPLRNAEITILGPRLRKQYYTKEDGSYFVERLCPYQNYSILVSHKIPGLSFQLLRGIKIESGVCTPVKHIIFNTDDCTGVEGFVTSALDGKPLPGVKILLYYYLDEYAYGGQIAFGNVRTDSKGYFYIRNIDPPGKYYIQKWLPRRPYPMDPHTGEKVYTFDDYVRNKEKINITVNKGKLIRLSISLDVPSYTGHWSDKTE